MGDSMCCVDVLLWSCVKWVRINLLSHSDGDSSASVPQVLAMSDIMAGTTLEDLEYSDDGDDLDSDEDDLDQVR